MRGISYRIQPQLELGAARFSCDFVLRQGAVEVFLDQIVQDRKGTSIYGPLYLRNYDSRRRLAQKHGLKYLQLASYL